MGSCKYDTLYEAIRLDVLNCDALLLLAIGHLTSPGVEENEALLPLIEQIQDIESVRLKRLLDNWGYPGRKLPFAPAPGRYFSGLRLEEIDPLKDLEKLRPDSIGAWLDFAFETAEPFLTALESGWGQNIRVLHISRSYMHCGELER